MRIAIFGVMAGFVGFILGYVACSLISRPKLHHTEEQVVLDNSKLDPPYKYPSIESKETMVKIIRYYNGPHSDKFYVKVFDLEGKRYTTLQAAAPDWEDGWCWRQDILSIGNTPK